MVFQEKPDSDGEKCIAVVVVVVAVVVFVVATPSNYNHWTFSMNAILSFFETEDRKNGIAVDHKEGCVHDFWSEKTFISKKFKSIS